VDAARHPSQVRLFKGVSAAEPIPYYGVNPENPSMRPVAPLGPLEAEHHGRRVEGGPVRVSYRPADFISATQSQYGFSAFADGYYFNVARCLPVVSGHGGYDDLRLLVFQPVLFPRDGAGAGLAKPLLVYLPTWYGNTPSERFAWSSTCRS